MGTPEIVVKRARPCSSTFTPVGAPIGFSGAFSNVGSRVFSAQRFSESLGWRFSTTFEIGVSGTAECFLSAIALDPFDNRRRSVHGASTQATTRSVARPVIAHTRRSELRLYEKIIVETLLATSPG